MYGVNAVGGAFFVNRSKYIEAGLENENFYGWGLEDGERFVRWNKLGYKVQRVNGVLFHLSHERGLNSIIHSPIQSTVKRMEKTRILNMPKSLLRDEVSSWSKATPF
jgi:predicted glycosyltransferase involved in capsule biosynthesis